MKVDKEKARRLHRALIEVAKSNKKLHDFEFKDGYWVGKLTSTTKTVEPGRKDDSSKPRYDLLPAEALHAVVLVLTYGAEKYGDENWRLVPNSRSRYFAAALRHLWSWWRSEALDPDTKLPHLAHAACCVLFLLEKGEKP